MRLFGREFKGFAQWLIFFVMVLLVSSGLCGVQFAIASEMNGAAGPLSGVIIVTGFIELAVMLVSAAGVVVVLIAWALYTVVSQLNEQSGEGPKDEPEKPSGDKD